MPANVYVKKTALGQQTIDISGLAAPSSEKKDLEAATATNSQEVKIHQCSGKVDSFQLFSGNPCFGELN